VRTFLVREPGDLMADQTPMANWSATGR
jgi:hypothetical protein